VAALIELPLLAWGISVYCGAFTNLITQADQENKIGCNACA
jgi:hypothetical protein